MGGMETTRSRALTSARALLGFTPSEEIDPKAITGHFRTVARATHDNGVCIDPERYARAVEARDLLLEYPEPPARYSAATADAVDAIRAGDAMIDGLADVLRSKGFGVHFDGVRAHRDAVDFPVLQDPPPPADGADISELINVPASATIIVDWANRTVEIVNDDGTRPGILDLRT